MPAAPDRLSIGTPSPGISDLPTFIAEKKGFFKDANVVVELVETGAASQAALQVITGDLDIAHVGVELLQAGVVDPDRDYVVIGNLSGPIYSFAATEDVKSLEDLEGKTIAVSDLESAAATIANIALGDELGLDYKLLPVGGTPARIAAVEGGQADATLIVSPQEGRVRALGMNVLEHTAKLTPDFAGTAMQVSSEVLDARREPLVRFGAALLRAQEWFYDESNRGEAAEILAEAVGIDLAHAQDAVELFTTGDAAGVIPRDGLLDPETVDATLKILRKAGNLTADLSCADVCDETLEADAQEHAQKMGWLD